MNWIILFSIFSFFIGKRDEWNQNYVINYTFTKIARKLIYFTHNSGLQRRNINVCRRVVEFINHLRPERQPANSTNPHHAYLFEWRGFYYLWFWMIFSTIKYFFSNLNAFLCWRSRFYVVLSIFFRKIPISYFGWSKLLNHWRFNGTINKNPYVALKTLVVVVIIFKHV